MDIKNLEELKKTDPSLILFTKRMGEISGKIERLDISAKTVIIRTTDGQAVVIEAADIKRVKLQG